MLERGQELLTIRFESILPSEYQQAHKAASRVQRQQITVFYAIFLLAFFFLIYGS